jgi:polyferredoxin
MKRRVVQSISFFLHNGYLGFPFTKNLYTGPLKGLCAPGLNCYSCPASLFSCPLGVLQNLLSALKVLNWQVLLGPFLYVLGFFLIFGLTLGRFICGWVCPFGFLQDLIYKVPFFKERLSLPKNSQRYIKHLVLIGLIFLTPLFLRDEIGYGILGFCKYLCPAGTLEAGYLNLILSPELWDYVGKLFYLKTFLLLLFVFFILIDYRFFCKNVCPLGLIYGLFNKISFLRLNVNLNRCTHCKACEKICPVGLNPLEEMNSVECIRCLNCVKICPYKAIYLEKGIYQNALSSGCFK